MPNFEVRKMFQFLKYIVLFVLGYKIIKELFKDTAPQKKAVRPPHANPNVGYTQQKTNTGSDKFTDAELIDYEEVK